MIENIWFIVYNTDTSEEGIVGCWKTKPTDDDIEALMRKALPGEFPIDPNTREEYVTIYYSLESLPIFDTVQNNSKIVFIN